MTAGARDYPGSVSSPGAAPTAHRVRSVLAIPAFRRLWLVTAGSATGEWLSLLALSALATQLADGYAAASFALGGVVATKLLPALLLGPLAGALADRFDRRRVMVVCDLLRFGLYVSIPVVGELWWLLVATLLIELCAMFWIPAKDAAVPNLLRRPDQVETANQLALVVTYGVAVLLAAGLFTVWTRVGSMVGGESGETATLYFAVAFTGVAYLVMALTVGFGIPEISGRATERRERAPSVLALLRDGVRYVTGTPLVRGLVIGIVGAFAAGGTIIGSGTLYAASLSGGNAAYGLLFAAVFAGLAAGMGGAPQLARRLPRSRLFGAAIVAAGVALAGVALAPHLAVALVAVALVGAFAGVAFLTGLTIIGAEVADDVRGRVVAFVQSIVRLTLLGSMALVPVVVGLVGVRPVQLFGRAFLVDGTRIVMLAGGAVAVVVGLLAHRQMDDRRTGLLPVLLAALRRSELPRTTGLLVAVEGVSGAAEQAGRLAARLRTDGHDVVAPDGSGDRERWSAAVRGAALDGPRARALAAAAVRADLVERVVRPALDRGAVVVVDGFVADPLARSGAGDDGVDPAELDGLARWATGRLRPDVTVLLDAAAGPAGTLPGEEHARVQRLMARTVAAEPGRHLVVPAAGDPDEVAQRVHAVLAPLLPPVPRGRPSGVPTSAGGEAP